MGERHRGVGRTAGAQSPSGPASAPQHNEGSDATWSVPPGAHGDDAVSVATALGLPLSGILDLAQTLNPVAPDVRPLVHRHLDLVRHYPDGSDARRALAAAVGVDVDQILLTNGGAEAIALIAAMRPVGNVEEPEFSLYRRHLDEVSETGGRWRSNPNNPLGTLAEPGEQADVWDEAFYQLATGTWTRGDAGHGTVALGSLTKLFGCPGLRLGYLVADPELIAAAEERQPRWSVNALASGVLPELLQACDLPAWSDSVSDLRTDLTGILEANGLRARASAAPWVLVDGVDDLRARLMPHGVLVRDCSSFGMPGVHRVAVPAPAGLERLADVLPRSLG